MEIQRFFKLSSLIAAAACLALAAGCGPATNNATDSGPAADAGNHLDSGSVADAGTPSDAGANILISDQFNNRVIEVTRAGDIVWTFGNGTADAGPNSVVAPNDAERLNDGTTLISATGTPPGVDPACTDMTNGCVDSRVLIVNHAGAITWQYGQAGVAGSDDSMHQLNAPVAAVVLPNSNVLITDQGNQRIIEVVQATKSIAWQYGMTGISGAAANQLNAPNSAERLANGNTLIADESNNRVIEVTNAMAVVWTYPATMDTSKLSGPAFASRLASGNTLISDANNNRIIEVNTAGDVVWSYVTSNRSGSNAAPLPTRGVRLANGDTLISDQFNQQVIKVNNAGTIVFSYGQLNVAGSGAGQLNAPYDAKAIGDFTGLTPPPM